MAASEFDPLVKDFLETQVTSLVQLEVLLLLRSSEERAWSAKEISHELRSDIGWIEERLENLVATGFLVVGEADALATYRYAPATDDMRRLADGVARAYEERRLAVISLVYAGSSIDRAPTSASMRLALERKKPD
jgi:hypothetical protein